MVTPNIFTGFLMTNTFFNDLFNKVEQEINFSRESLKNLGIIRGFEAFSQGRSVVVGAGLGYTNDGKYIYYSNNQIYNIDDNALPLNNNKKWISLVLRHLKIDDPNSKSLDLKRNLVSIKKIDSFELAIIQSLEGEKPARPIIPNDSLLIADILLESSGQFTLFYERVKKIVDLNIFISGENIKINYPLNNVIKQGNNFGYYKDTEYLSMNAPEAFYYFLMVFRQDLNDGSHITQVFFSNSGKMYIRKVHSKVYKEANNYLLEDYNWVNFVKIIDSEDLNTKTSSLKTQLENYFLETLANYYAKNEVYSRVETDNKLATTLLDSKNYTNTKIDALLNGATANLDTLQELAKALNNDANFANNVLSQISNIQNQLNTHNHNSLYYLKTETLTDDEIAILINNEAILTKEYAQTGVYLVKNYDLNNLKTPGKYNGFSDNRSISHTPKFYNFFIFVFYNSKRDNNDFFVQLIIFDDGSIFTRQSNYSGVFSNNALDGDFGYGWNSYTTTTYVQNAINTLKAEILNVITTKQDKITPNTAFNRNFGTGVDDVCRGNDSRLSDSRKCNNTFDNPTTALSNLNAPSNTEMATSIETSRQNILQNVFSGINLGTIGAENLLIVWNPDTVTEAGFFSFWVHPNAKYNATTTFSTQFPFWWYGKFLHFGWITSDGTKYFRQEVKDSAGNTFIRTGALSKDNIMTWNIWDVLATQKYSKDLLNLTCFVGELKYSACLLPEGKFLLCDGRYLPINDYPELYDRIKFTYGNNIDYTQFRLPHTQGLTTRVVGSQVLNGVTYNAGIIGNKEGSKTGVSVQQTRNFSDYSSGNSAITILSHGESTGAFFSAYLYICAKSF